MTCPVIDDKRTAKPVRTTSQYRHCGGRPAARFKRCPEDCVIAESDRSLLIVQVSVGEEFDADVVGIARFALEVVAYVHNLFTRKHRSMRRTHPLVQVDMESNVRPFGQPLYLSVRQPGIQVQQCNVAVAILREEISDLLRGRRLQAQQARNKRIVRVDSSFDRLNPAVEAAAMELVLVGVRNDNQIVISLPEIIQQSLQGRMRAIDRLKYWNNGVSKRVVTTQRT